jgi:hypothetical protein
LKLNGTHQILFYADDTNILGGDEITRKEKVDPLLVAIKESGLVVNADKIMYMVMSGDQTSGRFHNMKNDNISFERVEKFECLGTTLTNQNFSSGSNQEPSEVRECLLLFGAEHLVSQFAIKIYKDKNI